MKPDITRRRVLAGIASVSVGAVGYHYLTGRAVGLDNTEENDLVRVDWGETYNGEGIEPTEDEDSFPNNTTNVYVDGTGFVLENPVVNLTDVASGDSGVLLVQVTSVADSENSPIDLRLSFNLTEDAENGINEPENRSRMPNPDSTPDKGELGEHVDVLLWEDTGAFDISWLGEGDADPEIGETVITQGTVSLRQASDGVNSYRLNDGDCFATDESAYVGMTWSVDEEVGNIIQTDSVSFDLRFDATTNCST
ncbi:MAG: hypothetical protein SV253_02750 [Halobacteria archaeon]|nr:hypothetical protein [Halobacteria archaeon]